MSALPSFGWFGVVADTIKSKPPSPVRARLVVLAVAFALLAATLVSGCSPKPAPSGAAIHRVTGPLEVDGLRNGYPGEPLQVAGAEVSLAHDGNLVYVHLKAPAAGWLAVGFNKRGSAMDGANFILGSLDASGDVDVQNHLGRGFSHGPARNPAEVPAHVSRQGGSMIMEFAYPVDFPGDNGFALAGLTAGETIAVVVAYHRSEAAFLKHTSRGGIAVLVQ